VIKAATPVWYSVVAAVVLGVGGLASALPAQGSAVAPRSQQQASTSTNVVEADRAALTKALTTDLTKNGFQVNPGYPMLWPVDVCRSYLYPKLRNCLGNNPASPYLMLVVKAWPNEYVGPTPVDAFGPVKEGYVPTYRLDPRDAIVMYGEMPPPGKFMSLQTDNWSQHGRWKAKDYTYWAQNPNRPYPMQYMFATIPPNDPKSGRAFNAASLGDPVNNLIMQQQSGDPWGKNRYFIVTPSATTDRAVRRALQAQGVPDGAIFTEQIPSRDAYGPIGPLGMGQNAMDFWTFFKQAVPDDPVAARQWWANPPLTVLRVRAPSSLGPVQRYGSAVYGSQTGQSEAYLAGDLQNLVNAVCDRAAGTADLRSADCTQPPPASSVIDWFSLTGPYCRAVNCASLDNGDDATGVVSQPLPLDSGQVYAVVSTLATQTGNATYVALAVNNASTFAAPTGVTETSLNGSAEQFAANVNNTGKFFVHYFTRNCEEAGIGKVVAQGRLEQDCTSITDAMVPPQGSTEPGDPALQGTFMMISRDYTAPGTHKGPDPSKLLRPRILTFTKP
jgi:hypothetical protein